MTSNKTRIFIDGQHGTTGLKIHERLKDRPDIELLELPMADRKDLAKRVEIARAADIAVLCLPDAAVKELMAALGDADTCVIDASTEHFVFEVTGPSPDIERFIKIMTELGLVEVSRTGIAAMARGAAGM